MPRCTACGRENRPGARFCYLCGLPLAVVRPNEEDRRWLAASLADATTFESLPYASIDAGPLNDKRPALVEELPMEPDPNLFAGRYQLSSTESSGPLRVVDTTPWRCCWACGSTANEAGDAFCNDCGAALEPRSYRATLTPREDPSGVALAALIDDEAARAILPAIVSQTEQAGQVLTLLPDSSYGALAAPLDETSALTVGLSLARLLSLLHSQGMALGSLDPTLLEPVPGGGARLGDAPGLRRVPPAEQEAAVQADLAAFAELLEQLTAIPRTTQRLSEDEASALIENAEPGLAIVLRELRTGSLRTASALAERLEPILLERTSPVNLRQVYGASTDVGIVRDHNEDSYLTLQLALDNNSQPQAWGLYIVSDGMGGHAAGEVASGLAVRAAADLVIAEYLVRATSPDATYSEAAIGDLVRRAILGANEAIRSEGRSQGNDMGATLTMAIVVGNRAVIGNVGDSRTYLFRDGKLRRISKDHSLVQRLVDMGQIADEDIYTHPQRNAVLRSLGDRAEVEVDIFTERLRSGDALLLCSDGQWEMTRDPEMELLLSREEDPYSVCAALVAAANQAGGEDNITAVLVRFG